MIMEEKLRILLCEDDENLGMLLREFLQAKGYAADLFSDGESGYKAFLKGKYDLCVLDVMMPKKDGFTLAQEIRTVNSEVPVIFLTAKSLKEDILEGFKIGADDYITKPFLAQELLLRLHAVLRRVYRAASEEESARLGGTEVHWGTGTLRRDGREVPLTAKEFALLKKLWENHGNIVTIDALCQALWEGPMVGYENTLMVHIRRLREKLETDPSQPQYLLTVRGLGYRLAQEERP